MTLSRNKTILIGITGGIAAYKICELIRMFRRNNFNVKILTTPNAMNFVTEHTLATLSNNEVYSDNFKINEYKPEHISLCDEGDILVIAPATANTISKIANGICDNLLTTITCAFKKPVIIAPAMNTNMWDNPIIQENIDKLKQKNYIIAEPESGHLACGTDGVGRLCSLETIYNLTIDTLKISEKFKGKKFVITSGGTIEKIDPVRYISNFSSGKMGVALADVAYSMGGEVELISTFMIDKPYRVTVAKTALEMEKEVNKHCDDTDCIIMAAAIGDFRVENYSEQKIKKTDTLTLNLIKNPDILKNISQNKKDNLTVIGFSAESENLLENAKTKIKNKGCDYIIANDISKNDIGFSSDDNEVYIIDKSLNTKHLEKNSKMRIAREILEYIF